MTLSFLFQALIIQICHALPNLLHNLDFTIERKPNMPTLSCQRICFVSGILDGCYF